MNKALPGRVSGLYDVCDVWPLNSREIRAPMASCHVSSWEVQKVEDTYNDTSMYVLQTVQDDLGYLRPANRSEMSCMYLTHHHLLRSLGVSA